MPWMRDILPDSNLKFTISRMTPSALRNRLAEARTTDEECVKLGSKGYSFDLVEDLLERAEAALMTASPAISQPSSTPAFTQEANMDSISNLTSKSVAKPSTLPFTGTKRQVESTTAIFGVEAAEFESSLVEPERKRRKIAGTKDDVQEQLQKEADVLKTVLLDHYEKEELQQQDFDESEKADFEEVRLKFKNDATARKELGWSRFGEKYLKAGREAKDSVGPERSSHVHGEAVDSDEGQNESEEPLLEEDADANEQEDDTDVAELLKKYEIFDGVYEPKPLDEKLIAAMKASLETHPAPRFLYRASSWEGRKHTNGHDELKFHVPAAHKNVNEKCHDTFYDIPNGIGELVEMLGHRFLWVDRRRDETLSWTSSLLFALVHATGRLAKGQRHVVIQVIDTTKVTTLEGNPVRFHFAPDLMRILDIQGWDRWDDRFERNNLNQPWYTHEWISHHVVLSPAEYSYEVNIEDLIDEGLFGFVKSLRVGKDDMRSLYHRCGYTRSSTHHLGGSLKALSLEELVMAKRLACCFLDSTGEGQEPPLSIFLDFLGLVARPKNDQVFMQWMQQHYTAADVQNADYCAMTRIANNLPELAQTLDLAREAHAMFNLSSVPTTRVWMADADFDFYCKYTKAGTKEIKIRERRVGKKKGEKKKEKGKETADKTSEKTQEESEKRETLPENAEEMDVVETAVETVVEKDADDDLEIIRASTPGPFVQASPGPRIKQEEDVY